MVNKRAKASIIAASGVLSLLALWELDERINHSRAKGKLIKMFIDYKTVDLDEAIDWLKRSPLLDDTEDGEEIVDAVMEEGILRRLLHLLPHSGDH